jgi:hypothetical protein
MSEWLAGVTVENLTTSSLLALGVLMLMLGILRPRSAIVEIREDRDARLADKDRQIESWQEAHRLQVEASNKKDEALREALEVARAANDALNGFRQAATWISNGDRESAT